MKIIDALKLSFFVLRANKTRSFLTGLGIIIGIASVIIIMSVGAGAQSLIINQFSSFGSELIGILPGAAKEDGPPASALGIVVTSLKYSDAKAIAKQVPNVIAVSSYNTGIGTMSYQNNKVEGVNFYGVMAGYPIVENTAVVNGRFISQEEEKSTAKVAVLGHQVWQELFAGENPIGRRIKIKKELFEVIGVMKERGSAGFQNQDNIVLIPAMTAQKLMLGVRHVNFIRLRVNNTDNIDRAIEDIKFLLRDRHDIKPGDVSDFKVVNTKDAVAILTQLTDSLKFFLTAIAAISLIVGGVGVMNIMLAAVNERVREIGLRYAVGAKSSHIISQFILETVAITMVSGVIGIVIGSLISAVVAIVARYMGYQWDLVVTPSSVLMGVTVAALVGLVFGIYPAWKASKLQAIEALRYE